VRAASHCCGMM